MESVTLTRISLIFLLGVLWPGLLSAQDALHQDAFDSSADQQVSAFHLLASGSLRADYFRSSRAADGDTDFYGATAQIKLTPVLNDNADGKVEARFMDPDITDGGRAPRAGSVVESYVNVHMNQVDLRVGKQNVAWGRVDAANPTDNLTPRDYTILLPFQEDQRFGTTSIKLDAHTITDYTFTLFITPLFEPSKLPLPLPSGAAIMNNKPVRTLSNTEVGLKADKTGGDIDWSVSYYHGFSLLPEIRLVNTMPSGALLELRYPEMNVFGADIARNYGIYGFRAEAAYFAPKDYSGQQTAFVQPYLSYVLGADRTFFSNFNINLQILGNWVASSNKSDSIGDPIQRSLAEENAVLFHQVHRTNYGLTLRAGDRWFNETLEAEIFFMAYFSPLNTYVRPLVTYSFTDMIKGSIGAELYSGSPFSYFGSIKSNKGVFAEIRFSI